MATRVTCDICDAFMVHPGRKRFTAGEFEVQLYNNCVAVDVCEECQAEIEAAIKDLVDRKEH